MTDATTTCPFCAEEIKAAAMLCKHCGSSLLTAAAPSSREHEFKLGRCVHCGVSSTDALTYGKSCITAKPVSEPSAATEIAPDTVPPKNLLHCPKCRSTHLTAQKQGFGLGKAVVGGVLTGGVGLLAGFVGSGKVKVTCLQCGHAWTPGKK